MKPIRLSFITLLLSVFSVHVSYAEKDTASNFPDDYNNISSKKKLSDLNRRKKDPFGINIYGFGPIGLAAVSVDCFFTPKFALEAGAGFRNFEGDPSYTIGARYHIFGKTFLSLTPYVGIYTAFHRNGSTVQNNSLYIPVGIHKIKKNHVSWSIEAAYQRSVFNGNGFSGGFRIGYRF